MACRETTHHSKVLSKHVFVPAREYQPVSSCPVHHRPAEEFCLTCKVSMD